MSPHNATEIDEKPDPPSGRAQGHRRNRTVADRRGGNSPLHRRRPLVHHANAQTHQENAQSRRGKVSTHKS